MKKQLDKVTIQVINKSWM